MDDDTVRIAIGLRLGAPLCLPHVCHHCGAEVDNLGTHGLSCRKSQGRHPRHASINSLIQRYLSAAGIPAHLEPNGLCHSDGKHPDGVSIIPWSCGRVLVWDATCPDTLAPSHIALASREPGLVAEQAEQQKKAKYADLLTTHHFVPIGIETTGVFGPEALSFFKELGRRLRARSGEPLSFSHWRKHSLHQGWCHPLQHPPTGVHTPLVLEQLALCGGIYTYIPPHNRFASFTDGR